MLTMEEALQLLREGERRKWLIADWDWDWDISKKANGGVYIGLIRADKSGSCLDHANWDVMKCSRLNGFSTWREGGKELTEYFYAPVSGESWPLVIHRDFHGLAEDQYDLLEEFRLFHNLWHDRKTDEYYKILDDGTQQKIVFRDTSGATLVDTVALQQFAGARDLKILLQVESEQFFDEPQNARAEEIREPGLCADYHVTNDPVSDYLARVCFLGKRLIDGLPKDKCGIWPYKHKKFYESFIIGVSEDGSDACFTSDPDQLPGFCGKNPDTPNRLTLVHFRKDVLRKYLDKPSLYSVDDGYLRCGGLWGLYMDNHHDDKVIVFLGHLGRDLPESEQRYWRSYNVKPDGGLSEIGYKRSFLAESTDPTSPELTIKNERLKLLKTWQDVFGFDLYVEFHEGDSGILSDLRSPISDEWKEFDTCTIAATKVFIDYLNESQLAKLAATEIEKMKEADPEKPIRGIDKLQAWLTQQVGADAPLDCIDSLRLLQELRSKSAAHRKSSGLMQLLESKGLNEESPRVVYRQLILEPMLIYCRRLTDFARQRLDSQG